MNFTLNIEIYDPSVVAGIITLNVTGINVNSEVFLDNYRTDFCCPDGKWHCKVPGRYCTTRTLKSVRPQIFWGVDHSDAPVKMTQRPHPVFHIA